jgi:hypothetical protein
VVLYALLLQPLERYLLLFTTRPTYAPPPPSALPCFCRAFLGGAQLALQAATRSRGRSKSYKIKKQVGKLAGADRQRGGATRVVAIICCYLTARRYAYLLCAATQLHMPMPNVMCSWQLAAGGFAQSTPKSRPNRMHMPMWLVFFPRCAFYLTADVRAFNSRGGCRRSKNNPGCIANDSLQ